MKKLLLSGLLTGLVAIQTASAVPISLNFSEITDASVQFTGTGNTFRMLNSDGTDTDHTGASRDFSVTSSTGLTGAINGLLGNITGTFTIGAISSPIAGFETAPVSGAGTFSINDGAGSTFTAALDWLDIQTVFGAGGINAQGNVNLSSFSYGGLNTDLLTLAAQPGGIVTATFQFIPPLSLTQLTTDGAVNATSYSGSLTAVPEPSFYGLVGLGLGGLLLAVRRRKEA